MAKKKTYNIDQKIKIAIRRIWAFSPNRRECLKAALIGDGYYRCAHCKRATEKATVDHKTPIGMSKGWDEFVKAMFIESIGLQCLCSQCHKTKSKNDLKEIKNAHTKY